jgi:hypothetical protein
VQVRNGKVCVYGVKDSGRPLFRIIGGNFIDLDHIEPTANETLTAQSTHCGMMSNNYYILAKLMNANLRRVITVCADDVREADDPE